MKAKIEMLVAATGLAFATASAAEWEGSFANGLEGWKTTNYNRIAALSVEDFAGERAFVVRHSGTNSTSGTAWELRGERFAVTPGERLMVIVRARGTVESMIVPNGFRGSFKTAVRWYDLNGRKLEDDSDFGIAVSDRRWQYSFAKMTVPVGAAFAEASLGADRPDFKTDDVLAVSAFKVVSAPDAAASGTRTKLRDDGALLVDDKPFFPIGVYSVRKCKFNGFSLEKAFADLKAAGFNTVLMNGTKAKNFDEFLDLAGATGMKTFMPPAEKFDDDLCAKGYVQTYRRHPSVIAWYLADDTSSWASPGEVADRHRVCHALDPDRLTLQADGTLTSGGHNRYMHYVHSTDIFLPEIYPWYINDCSQDKGIARFVRDMRAVNAALAENGSPAKGIWPIVQFFSGWGHSVFPNEAQLRAQCFAALAHKARGLMLYLYGSRNEEKNHGAVSTPERWATTRRVFGEVASIADDLLLRDAVEQPMVEVVAGRKADALGLPPVSLLQKAGERPLLIAVNSASECVKARFAVKGFSRAEEIFEHRVLPIVNGGFEDEFASIGVHVYRLDGVSATNEIVCEGAYDGHLQGVDTDGTNIWWSFTSTLVRTDLKGRVLAKTEAPRHQGDLCVRSGRLYVAVNRGKFNQPDEGVSEVTAYDAQSLAVLKTWSIDLPFGACGMTEKDGHFFVVGGLPATVEFNWVAEYDADFKLVKMHQLKTGFTLMGMQTASAMNGRLYFGIYGSAGDPPGVLDCPGDLSSFTRHVGHGSMGILKIGNTVYTAQSAESNAWGKHPKNGRLWRLRRAKLVADPSFCTAKTRYEPKRTGRGLVRVYFEGHGTNGWHDVGYSLCPNGYEPLFCPGKLPVFRQTDEFCFWPDPPAVGIGGSRSYGTADLVRAVRRCAENDEAFALHVPGLPEDVRRDVKLEGALSAVAAECACLGVKYDSANLKK